MSHVSAGTRLRRRLSTGAIALAIALGLSAHPASAATETLFDGSLPAIRASSDARAVTLGTTFRALSSSQVSEIRFYKGTGNTGTHVAALFRSDGSIAARGSFTEETASGWQVWRPQTAVHLAAGDQFTAAVFMPNGRYSAALSYPWPRQKDSLIGTAGVYAYGSSLTFPRRTWQSANYYIDVSFSADAAAPSASPTSTPTATQSSTPTPSPTVTRSPTPTPTPSATRTPSPSVTPTPTMSASPSPTASASTMPGQLSSSARGWEITAANVGLRPYGLSCASLPAYTGPSKPATGARISGVRVTTHLDLSAGDITIDKSCIQPTTLDGRALVENDVCGADECLVPTSKSVTIRDSEFDASALPASSIAAQCAFLGAGTLQRNYMHGMGSGICFFGTGYYVDAIAEQNYVTGLRSAGSSHNEAATVRDFRTNLVSTRRARFTNNRLDCQSGNETGGLFIQTTWVDINHLAVEGNYFEGAGYNLYLSRGGGAWSDLSAVDNRFRPTGWGPAAADSPGWTVWRDNYRYDPTKTDGRGATVPNP